MPTAPRLGFNKARTVGSGPDNASVSLYQIASGYSTALGVGDLVQLTGTGSQIQQGANSAYNLGVLQGVYFIDPITNRPVFNNYWPAAQTTTGTAYAYVMDDPRATFNMVTTDPIGDMKTGLFYAVTLTAPDSNTHRSTMKLNNTVTKTGTLAVTGTDNSSLSGLQNGSAFNISTSVNATPVTITIVTNQTPAQLLALLNAVPGIKASLNGSSYLVVATTDGGSLILADGAHTPLASSNLLVVAGTYTASVAKSASAVKIINIVDTVNNVVEVCLTNDELLNNR